MDAVHIHLLLNHVPILGTIFATLLFAYAFVRGSDELKRLSMILLVVAAVVAVPIYLTGEPSEDAVEGLVGVDKGSIEQHESAAKFSIFLVVAAGIFSMLGMLMMRSRKEIARWFVLGALAMGAISAASMARTGNLGGMIRHSEIRGPAAATTQSEQDTGRQRNDDDDH
jgi:uncharacterized membrane protein